MKKLSARTQWTIAIVGLLVANVVAMVVLAVTANVGASKVIPSYYQEKR